MQQVDEYIGEYNMVMIIFVRLRNEILHIIIIILVMKYTYDVVLQYEYKNRFYSRTTSRP